jgi:hypothetical protein
MTELNELKKILVSAWGKSSRSAQDFSSIKIKTASELLEFEKLTNESKSYLATILIIESLNNPGSYIGNGDESWFLKNFYNDISFNIIEEIYGDRKYASMQFAIYIAACDIPFTYANRDGDLLLNGGRGLATMFLISQLEFYFRKNNSYTDFEGKVVVEFPIQLDKILGKQNLNRINSIKDIFLIFMFNNTSKLAETFKDLNQQLIRKISIGIAERLKLIRDPMMHGVSTDSFTEGRFYGLMHAIIYYSEISNSSSN